MDELLFHKRPIRTYFDGRIKQLERVVESYEPDYLLKVSESDLISFLLIKYRVPELRIIEQGIYQDDPEDSRTRAPGYDKTIEVLGTIIRVHVPFEGDPDLFRYRPSLSTTNFPRATLKPDELQLNYSFVQEEPATLRQRYERDIAKIQKYVSWANKDVSSFNATLEETIRQTIQRRKKKLLVDRQMSSALGIPLKKREGAPRSYTIPISRRQARIHRPTVNTEEPFEQEPALAESEYNEILRIIQSMVQVIERSPHAFSEMNEEDLRQHFLVQLNGQYDGQATGETFNFTGKTDILIRVDGKNIFIAECKIWKGPKSLRKTVDQLLSYASWRDTKTAILLFNRNKYFSKVLEKVPGLAEKHSCYKRTIGVENETTFRYVFHQPGDPNRELLLTILTFNVPAAP